MPKIKLPDGRVISVPDDARPEEIDAIANEYDTRQPPPAEQGSAMGRFAGGVGEMLNPVTIGEGVYQTVRHPIDTLMGAATQTGELIKKGGAAGREGRYGDALRQTVLGAVPVMGPLAEDLYQQASQGDWAGAAGRATGLAVAPKVYGAALGGASRVAKAAANTERAATALERGAASRVVDVMAPKVGPNKTRFGGMAEDVAPRLAKEEATKAFSREGLYERVSTKLGDAESALDQAADARLKARTFSTKPILDELLKRRQELTAQAVEGSSPIPSIKTVEAKPRPSNRYGDEGFTIPSPGEKIPTKQVPEARPLGRDVVPGPNATRVAVIDQAIEEIKALGPVAQYEPLRRIRQAYDAPAKIKYSPSMTADFLKKSGEASGAADVTGTLRDALAKMDPQTATANTEYAFWRKANDVLEATSEVERTRPKVGRIIAARIAATVFGGSAAGPAGAAAGLLGGPMLESILSSAPTTKLRTARVMSQLAGAIRRGDLGHVTALTTELTRLSGVQ